MPKVTTVKKAAKDYPDFGIKKGEQYYWWKFRYGGKHVSKTFPKSSQLTQSDYLSRIYSFQEQEISGSIEELEAIKDDLVASLEELRDEQDERLNNMPEGLQQGSTGELLQERYDCVDSAISELEGIDFEIDEDNEDQADSIISEIESALSNLA